MRRLSLGFSFLIGALLLGLLPACGSGSGGKIKLVAYSTPREAYAEIIPAFEKTAAGSGVEVDESYGASGEQARSVLAGLETDVAAFSLEPDMTKLVEAGLVDKSWNANSYHGMVTDSIVVFVVRPGNPKKIQTWDDLLKPGVDVITPNPFTSGGARWNVMAAYGAWLKQGSKPAQAVTKLEQLFRNVSVQNKSAREALQTFDSGKGDVLLAYENEAYFAKKEKQPIDYVTPKATILIENPVAVTSDSADPTAAKAFLDFLYTPTAQRIYAENGYRPVVKKIASEFATTFPTDLSIFTIDELGGWAKVMSEFFDPDKGTMATIERSVGGSTG
ncbi:MAG: sulfate ABC transporter substrate-binding protein [Gaiellaceae bacterium]